MMTLNERRAQLYKRFNEEQEYITLTPALSIEEINTKMEIFLFSGTYYWKDILTDIGYVVGFILLSRVDDPDHPDEDVYTMEACYVEPHYRKCGFMTKAKEDLEVKILDEEQ